MNLASRINRCASLGPHLKHKGPRRSVFEAKRPASQSDSFNFLIQGMTYGILEDSRDNFETLALLYKYPNCLWTKEGLLKTLKSQKEGPENLGYLLQWCRLFDLKDPSFD